MKFGTYSSGFCNHVYLPIVDVVIKFDCDWKKLKAQVVKYEKCKFILLGKIKENEKENVSSYTTVETIKELK